MPAVSPAQGRFRAAHHAAATCLAASGLLLGGCGSPPATLAPSIAFSRVPEANEGGPDRLEAIEGVVSGARPGQKLVLFARSGLWWVQPLASEPFTLIRPDSTWRTETHLGTEYAALLVEPTYRPPPTTPALPAVGEGVVAVAIAKGSKPSAAASKVVQFSGYDWKVRSVPSDRGDRWSAYAPENGWTDEAGALHLRVSTGASGWACAELRLTRSFGYGTYVFVVQETSHLDPRTVLTLFTWDDFAAEQRREMNIEISRWGDPSNKNAQFVVQPYYMPANVTRFAAPAGTLTHTLRWELGRATFRTTRGLPGDASAKPIAEHVFTSGVPSAGSETVRINLHVFADFDKSRPIENEVVIQKFEYLP